MLILLGAKNGYTQNQWNPFYDYAKKYHFGFGLGLNFGKFKYNFSQVWYNQDSIKRVQTEVFPGLSISALADVHIGEYADIRLVPSFSIAQRNINYYGNNNRKTIRIIESSILEIPLLFKYKSVRHQNFRMYAIGGFKYGYDFASDKGAIEDPLDPKLKIEPHNYSIEAGIGFDLYFKYFKLSPEIKLSNGLNNVLIKDERIHSLIFDKFHSRFILFNFYFEG